MNNNNTEVTSPLGLNLELISSRLVIFLFSSLPLSTQRAGDPEDLLIYFQTSKRDVIRKPWRDPVLWYSFIKFIRCWRRRYFKTKPECQSEVRIAGRNECGWMRLISLRSLIAYPIVNKKRKMLETLHTIQRKLYYTVVPFERQKLPQ